MSGGADRTIGVWSLENRTQEAVLNGHNDWVSAVCISTDGKWIASE